MAIRTHLGRSLDMSLPSNRLAVGLAGVALVAAAVVVMTGGPPSTWLAPVYVGLTWALGRELDPDHDATALIAAVGTGIWVLAGFDASAWLAVGAFVVAGRLILSSTGRRPLLTDYLAVGIFAAAISFTITGFVGGFAIALGIYIDDRMADEHRQMAIISAALTALAVSVVASASQAFPKEVPDARSVVVIGLGLIALVAVMREPVPPISVSDSRLKNRLTPERLQATRATIGVLVFVAAFLSGPDALAMAPAGWALSLALIANELERIRRSPL